MKLSKLQKFILLNCWYWKDKKTPRREFFKFYENCKKKPLVDDLTKIVTRSLERLIKKNLIVGFGEITSQKIFIDSVRLTRVGRQELAKFLDRRQKLPLKVKNQKSKVSAKNGFASGGKSQK